MEDLRWALLGLGLLFVGGLAWWELRKPRHAGRDEGFESPGRVEPRMGDSDEGPLDVEAPLPSMRAVDSADPPVVMLEEMTDRPGSVEIAIASDVAIDEPRRAASLEPDADEEDEEGPPASLTAEAPPFDVPTEAAVRDPGGDARSGSAPQSPPAPPAPPAPKRSGPPEPNWPPEDQRRIVSLRVVPRPPGRFYGRALRLAFESAGLEFGAFDIFHLVDESGEVVASAANLMRPGTFNPAMMDGAYFHGVHLFCVLPGPLPAGRAVDELIALARDLGQRISGMVLDGVGQPLDEERAATLRDEAVAAERAG